METFFVLVLLVLLVMGAGMALAVARRFEAAVSPEDDNSEDE